jgi:hypothetical protein
VFAYMLYGDVGIKVNCILLIAQCALMRTALSVPLLASALFGVVSDNSVYYSGGGGGAVGANREKINFAGRFFTRLPSAPRSLWRPFAGPTLANSRRPSTEMCDPPPFFFVVSLINRLPAASGRFGGGVSVQATLAALL